MKFYFTGKARWWGRVAALSLTISSFILTPFGAAWAATNQHTLPSVSSPASESFGGFDVRIKDPNKIINIDYSNPLGGAGSVSNYNYSDYQYNLNNSGVGAGAGGFVPSNIEGSVGADANLQGNAFSAQAIGEFGNIEGTEAANAIYGGGVEGSGGDTYGLASGGSEFAACTLGSIIANFISTFITTLISHVLAETVAHLPWTLLTVPTNNKIEENSLAAIRSKDVCSLMLWGVCILPSLDSLFYCLVNGVIQYIGQATVRWINSGFQGNPAFISDPDQFFKDAADNAAGAFINSISEGLLCEPFRAAIQLQLLTDYQLGSSGGFERAYNGSSCALTRVSRNSSAFLDGDFSQGENEALRVVSWDNASNPAAAKAAASVELWGRVAGQDVSLKLQFQSTNGWQHVRDPETGRITTHGRIIQDLVNKRLFNGEQRLLFATQFDQVIAALVNQLVKIALSEVLKIGQ